MQRYIYRHTCIWYKRIKSQNLYMFLVLSCSCLWPIHCDWCWLENKYWNWCRCIQRRDFARVIPTASWFIAINVQHGTHRSCSIEPYERECWQGSHTLVHFCPWEFPEISLAYSHISLKGPGRSMIYGKIFWPPHTPSPYRKPGLHLPSKLTILCFSVFLSYYLCWECRQYLQQIWSTKHIRHINDIT